MPSGDRNRRAPGAQGELVLLVTGRHVGQLRGDRLAPRERLEGGDEPRELRLRVVRRDNPGHAVLQLGELARALASVTRDGLLEDRRRLGAPSGGHERVDELALQVCIVGAQLGLDHQEIRELPVDAGPLVQRPEARSHHRVARIVPVGALEPPARVVRDAELLAGVGAQQSEVDELRPALHVEHALAALRDLVPPAGRDVDVQQALGRLAVVERAVDQIGQQGAGRGRLARPSEQVRLAQCVGALCVEVPALRRRAARAAVRGLERPQPRSPSTSAARSRSSTAASYRSHSV